jgi:copper chaperone CopZ
MSRSRPRTVARMTIPGMTAVHATRAVFTALGGIDGVLSADVSRGVATVEHDGSVTDDALRSAVSVAGFEVVEIRSMRAGLPLV